MTRARELANFADDTAGLETLTVSDITDLSVSASNINSATNQITDSSTDLNVDSNTLVVDKSTNRIGIGNNAPTNELTIGPTTPGADVGNAIELRGSAGDSSLQRFQIYNNGASGKTEFKLGRGGNSPSTFLTIGPNDTVFNTGNVGVNTSSPDAPLDIEASHSYNTDASNHANGLRLTNASTGNMSIEWWHSTGSGTEFASIVGQTDDIGSNTYDDGNLVFRTKHEGTMADRMLIQSNGFVGIGNNAPASLLDIKGTNAVADNAVIQFTDSSGNQEHRIGAFGLNLFGMDVTDGLQVRDLSDSYETRFIIDNTGNIGMGTNQPTARLDVRNPKSSPYLGITFHPVSTDTHITSNGYWTGSQWERINSNYGVANWWHNAVDDLLYLRMADSGSNPISGYSTIIKFIEDGYINIPNGRVVYGTDTSNTAFSSVFLAGYASPNVAFQYDFNKENYAHIWRVTCGISHWNSSYYSYADRFIWGKNTDQTTADLNTANGGNGSWSFSFPTNGTFRVRMNGDASYGYGSAWFISIQGHLRTNRA